MHMQNKSKWTSKTMAHSYKQLYRWTARIRANNMGESKKRANAAQKDAVHAEGAAAQGDQEG